MAAASLWNIFQWAGPAGCLGNPPAACLLTAYVSIPKDVWVLAGITLTANFGVRLAFRLNRGEAKSSRHDKIQKVRQLMSSPLDLDAKPQMGIAQYLMLNMVGILVYGIAIARIFGVVKVRESVGSFPSIPPEMLSLMGISAGALVAVNSLRNFRAGDAYLHDRSDEHG